MEAEIHPSLPGLILVCVDRLYSLANPFLLVFLQRAKLLSIKNENDKATVNAFLYFSLLSSPSRPML